MNLAFISLIQGCILGIGLQKVHNFLSVLWESGFLAFNPDFLLLLLSPSGKYCPKILIVLFCNKLCHNKRCFFFFLMRPREPKFSRILSYGIFVPFFFFAVLYLAVRQYFKFDLFTEATSNESKHIRNSVRSAFQTRQTFIQSFHYLLWLPLLWHQAYIYRHWHFPNNTPP